MVSSAPTSALQNPASSPWSQQFALTFDDVLLVPQFSRTLPSETDTRTTLGHSDFSLNSPILSAAMDTVTEARMATAMALAGGLGVIHKNMTARQQAEAVSEVKSQHGDGKSASCDADGRLRVAAAVGVGEAGRARVTELVAAGVDALVVDTAHGHSEAVLSAVKSIKERWPEILLMAGNVATPEGTLALIEAGAQVVKVGVGPGSICTTRQVAGVGMPQLTALLQCAPIARARGCALIADGGIRRSGDVVKALAAGASAVMVGSLLARAEQAPGDIVIRDGKKMKAYRGMGSLAAMAAGSADRYARAQSGASSDKRVAEGVEAWVPVETTLEAILFQLLGGLQAGMGYLGAANLQALFENAHFVRITPAGVIEGGVHDVQL